ncbi:MAG: LuxR C-terminal-related transcriptional regulator [Clostridiales Family XIII bacterium]|jgi:LuxR family maltose regulon positive regulatory protein|nr:LuxR C-terminal-related transcriptional regulator [Clostridiales Family XIII bacterium]
MGKEKTSLYIENAVQEIPKEFLFARPRVRELFRKSKAASFITVVANAGYGKTCAVYQYLSQQTTPVVWYRFRQEDNNSQQFWDDYTAGVARYNKSYAERLRKCGFPGSDEKFDMYLKAQQEEMRENDKLFIVCDDFHNITNPEIMRFLEKAAKYARRHMTRILISRTEPPLDFVELFVKGRLVRITEEDLIFTRDETDGFLRSLGINLSVDQVDQLDEDTGGWAFAVSLVVRLLEKSGGQVPPARYAYKANIEQMIDLMVANSISEDLFKLLLKISLTGNRNADFIRRLAKSDALMKELNDMTNFVRFDQLMQVYEVHQMFLDYLCERQGALSEDEKREVFLLTAEWYSKDGQIISAAECYAKCREWKKVVEIARNLPQEFPEDVAETFLKLLAGCTEKELKDIPEYYPLRIRLLLCLHMGDEAKKEADDWIQYFSKKKPASAYAGVLGNLHFIRGIAEMLESAEKEHYDFTRHFESAAKYFERQAYDGEGWQHVWHLGAHALLIGTNRPGAAEEYLESLKAVNVHAEKAFHGRMSGLYDLALAEYYYYKGDAEKALTLSRTAYQKAAMENQCIIQNRAIIGRIFCASALGDYTELKRAKADLDMQYEKRDSLYRTATYDTAYASWCTAIGRPQDAAEWLKGRFTSDFNDTGTVLVENFLRYAKAKVLLRNMRYEEVLYFTAQECAPSQALLTRIGIKVLEAISRYRLGSNDAAYACLEEAYELSRSNAFDMHFIRYGKEMQALVRSALRVPGYGVPEEWLKQIYRRASIYVKRHKSIVDQYMLENNTRGAAAKITYQEKRLLTNIEQGLSQAEIAEEFGIAPRTARGMTERVMGKLGVSDREEAAKKAKEMHFI